jgi:hypothetical protein
MYFDGRELKEYIEPVKWKDLKMGSIYFTISFTERELLNPIIRSWVFVGKNLGNRQGFYFQELGSYHKGIRYDSASQEEKDKFMCCDEDQTKNIFEFEHMLDQLLKCSLWRRGIKGL